MTEPVSLTELVEAIAKDERNKNRRLVLSELRDLCAAELNHWREARISSRGFDTHNACHQQYLRWDAAWNVVHNIYDPLFGELDLQEISDEIDKVLEANRQ